MDWLDGYQLIGRLGDQSKRTFGSVYKGLDNKTGQEVVIKCVDLSSARPTAIAALKNEQRFDFKRPGLPRIIQFVETPDALILVKRFQPGVPLPQYWNTLAKKERIDFLQKFSSELTGILEYLHEQSIFHCDLKPSNILIQDHSGQMAIELIDFGLAIQHPVKERRSLIFPLGYAAPELILNHLDLINDSTDYFSMGILFWRLFCGRLPLQHPNPGIYTNLQLVHPLPDDAQLPKGLYPILSRLTEKPAFRSSPNRLSEDEVKTAIIHSQNKRYQSPQEFLQDLSNIRVRRFRYF